MSESAPALDYAAPPSARRQLLRRLRRWWPAWLVLMLAGVGAACGPGVWRRWRVWRLQEACMAAELPADRPVVEGDRAAARALIAARPGEYVSDPDGWAARPDSRWAALAGALGLPAWTSVRPGCPVATLFCHERRTPAGRRRLVVVEAWWWDVTVIDPAAWPAGGGPRVAWRDEVAKWDAATTDALGAADRLTGPTRLGAGVPDAADPSRFTVPFVFHGVAGTWEYRLGDDDRVTVRLLDPAGFKARAEAAKAAERTRPATSLAPAAGPSDR